MKISTMKLITGLQGDERVAWEIQSDHDDVIKGEVELVEAGVNGVGIKTKKERD